MLKETTKKETTVKTKSVTKKAEEPVVLKDKKTLTAKDSVTKKKTESTQGGLKKKYFYAVGRRKHSIASVRIYINGSGNCKVNEKDVKEYFPTLFLQETTVAPLTLTNQLSNVDLEVRVKGGGIRGQADAVRHGVARALVMFNEEFKSTIKKVGYLTRDSRRRERKKPGLHGARRAPQFSKR